jgi:hypothetical protein
VAACVLAEPKVWGGIVPPVGTVGEPGCAPVEVVVGGVAFAAAREIVQPGPAPACGTAFTDVQESSLASGPEAVETGGCRDKPVVAGLVELVPRRPGQATPVWCLGVARSAGAVPGQPNHASPCEIRSGNCHCGRPRQPTKGSVPSPVGGLAAVSCPCTGWGPAGAVLRWGGSCVSQLEDLEMGG